LQSSDEETKGADYEMRSKVSEGRLLVLKHIRGDELFWH